MNLTSTPKRGYGAWVDSGNIYTNHASSEWMQLQSGTRRGYIWLPMPDRMVGRTIASATLTGHAHLATLAQTLTFQAADGKWQASTITWNNQPGVTGSTATTVLGALNDGDEFTVDMTALVQAVANGTVSHFGWRVSTSVSSAAQKLANFDNGVDAWTLTVLFSEDPEAPSALAPNGTVVSAQKPVVTFDFTEYGATAADLAKVRVEVDYTGSTAVDWDSGWVTSVVPQMDLAAQGMTGTIAAGGTVRWRAYVQDANGRQSDPSDWATYTYRAMGAGTWSSPSGTTIFDPQASIVVNFSPATLAAFRVQVTDGTDRTAVRYDSGKLPATSTTQAALTLPLTDEEGTRIFTDNVSAQINVRLYDTYDREATPGLAPYVDLWKTVTFSETGSVAQTSTFASAQVGTTPTIRHTWTDSSAPDAYVIHRDGEAIARLIPSDVNVGGTSYQWDDQGAEPDVTHSYTLRRVVSATGRSLARTTSVIHHPTGVWLVRQNGDQVVLHGDAVDQFIIGERRLRYRPTNRQHAVDILTQYEGLSGPFVGTMDDTSEQSIDTAHAVLDAIKMHPTEPVQLMFGGFSKPVLVSNLTVLPDPDYYPSDGRRHRVSFYVDQVGAFKYKL